MWFASGRSRARAASRTGPVYRHRRRARGWQRSANDSEEGKRLRKIVHLPTKLTVAFGYEHSRLEPEGFPQPVHHRWNIMWRRSDDESVGQRRSAKNFLAGAQR